MQTFGKSNLSINNTKESSTASPGISKFENLDSAEIDDTRIQGNLKLMALFKSANHDR
jgi:hypothetical protein